MKNLQMLSAVAALMLAASVPCIAKAQSTAPNDATGKIDPGAATRPQAPLSRRQISSESADEMRPGEHTKESGKARKIPAGNKPKDPPEPAPQPMAGATPK